MNDMNSAHTRRVSLQRGGYLMLVAATAAVVARPRTARASKADKRDFYYQDHPKEGKSCASCRMFSLVGQGKGRCDVVEGDIAPNGWCMAYSPKV